MIISTHDAKDGIGAASCVDAFINSGILPAVLYSHQSRMWHRSEEVGYRSASSTMSPTIFCIMSHSFTLVVPLSVCSTPIVICLDNIIDA